MKKAIPVAMAHVRLLRETTVGGTIKESPTGTDVTVRYRRCRHEPSDEGTTPDNVLSVKSMYLHRGRRKSAVTGVMWHHAIPPQHIILDLVHRMCAIRHSRKFTYAIFVRFPMDAGSVPIMLLWGICSLPTDVPAQPTPAHVHGSASVSHPSDRVQALPPAP